MMARLDRAIARAVKCMTIVSICGLVFGPHVLLAQSRSDAITQYLAAGEFAPARRVARRLDDPVRRDRQLARIALAQAAMGARQASMATLRAVQGDLQRAAAVTRLANGGGGAAGGGAIADFDTLINLITSTVAPDSWSDVGGTGAIEPFPTGVLVDTSGVLRRLPPRPANPLLEAVRQRARSDWATARFAAPRYCARFP